MTPLDYSIVVVYLVGMVLMGLYFQRKASAGIDSYFLGNRNLPASLQWVRITGQEASRCLANRDSQPRMGQMGFRESFRDAPKHIQTEAGLALSDNRGEPSPRRLPASPCAGYNQAHGPRGICGAYVARRGPGACAFCQLEL